MPEKRESLDGHELTTIRPSDLDVAIYINDLEDAMCQQGVVVPITNLGSIGKVRAWACRVLELNSGPSAN